MLKSIKTHWRRAISSLLAVVMAAGMLPVSAFAADISEDSNPYTPTGNFELNVAGTTSWNGSNEALTVYKTESGSTQTTTIPAAVPFALLEDKGGDRLKVGYVADGGWTGGNLDGIGWVNKDSVLVNLPDVLPSIAYVSDGSKQFNSRLTRFEYAIPGSYALAKQLARLQQEAMGNGETLVVRQSGQTVSISRAKGDPAQLHSYSLDEVTYQKYNRWTEYDVEDNSLSDLSYELSFSVDRAYSADPSVTLTRFCPQTVRRTLSRVSASDPTGGVGAYNPGSPGGKKPSTSNVDWSTDPERTFLRFTLLEFPQGVVTDLNTNDYSTWHVVGTPLNVVWSNGWSADKCRSDITWYNSQAMSYNGMGVNAAQLMAGSSVAQGVYSYDATAGHNKRWVTTADEFQTESGITDQQKEQMFHCNSSGWSSGWRDGDYTSMWGTDAESVTPGNLYKVYKANDAFLYLLNRLSEKDNGAGGDIARWSKDEATEKWSEYVHDADGNLRTKYRVIVETGGVFKDPDGVRRAYTLREMMAYSIYNSESQVRGNLIWDQASTMVNMARWMRQGKDNQFLEYPLNENGTPTGEELHSTNGFRETDSYVDTIQYPRPIRDTIFSERRSFGLHIFSPFNFERPEPTRPSLEVTKKVGTGIPAGEEWNFTVKYTSGSPASFSAKKNDVDCTSQVTESGNGLKFKLKADETIRIDFEADSSFRCEVTEDDTSKLTNITGTGGTADMVAKKFTTTSGTAKVTFTNGTEPPPPDKPDDPPPTPTPGKAILYKRDANTNKGVGPATFKFSSVVNGVYEFDTNATGELETIQWWDPTEAAGKYIKPGEYAVTEIVPPPNYLPTTEVQQIKLELDADGKPIPAGPLVFKNLAKVGLRLVKYDRQSHQPMNGVTFEIFKDGTSIGRHETKGQGEIVLTGIEPGTYRAVEVDTGDEGHILDTSYQEVELVAGGGTKELIFFNDNKPGMKLVKVDSSDPSKAIPGAKFRIRAVDGSYGPQEFTTNGSGEIDLSNLPTGSYEVTEVECAGYVIDDAQRIIHLKANDTAQFVFTNTKKPGFRLIKTSADGAPLDGVTFKITPIEDASRSIDRTTQNGGEILVEGLESGIYSVQETATLPDHILDKTEYHVELSPGKTSELRLKNDKRPNLTIWKRDADTGEVVPDTVFLVKAADGHSVNEVRTGPDGKGTLENMLPGVYEISEKSVPEPYLQDAANQLVTLYPNKNREVLFENHKRPAIEIIKENSITHERQANVPFQIWYASNNTSTGEYNDLGVFYTDGEGRIVLTEPDIFLRDGWFRVKELEAPHGFALADPDTQEAFIPSGTSHTFVFQNRPLSAICVWKYDSVSPNMAIEGAVFQIRYLSGNTSGTGGTVIGTYRTGQNGSFTATGLPAGTYVIEELSSDGDHVIDTPPQTVYLSGDDQEVIQVHFGNSPKGSLLVKKVDSVTKQPLSDVEFLVTDSKGNVIGDANGKFVTDSTGSFTVSGIDPSTTLIVKEVRARDGYILDDVPQTATINAGQTVTLEFRNQPMGSLLIRKVCSVNPSVTLANAEFKVAYSDGTLIGNSNGVYRSDENGEVRIEGLIPGKSIVVTEIKAPAGFLIDAQPQTIVVQAGKLVTVTMKNQPRGKLIVQKRDSLTNQVLPGAQFRITTAAGCEVGLDGVIGTATLTSNGIFTTDSQGEIRISNLAPGAYVISEIKAPDNYVMDNPSTNVVIGPNGDTQTVIVTNTPKATLTILKRDAVTRKPLANAEFVVRDSEGHAVGPTNGVYKTGTDGTVVVSGLEPGASIMVSETKAPTGYILDETPKHIVVKSGISNSLIFDNEPGTTLIIQKFIEGTENEPLSGVAFKVTDGSGAAVGPDDGVYYTDHAGEIVLSGIEPGATVKVREIKTVEGFVLDGTPQDILIKGGEVQRLTFWNAQAGTLVIQKKDKVSGAFIPGAQFQLTYANGGYVDNDNGHLSSNGLYTTDDKGEIRISGIVGTVVAKEVKAAPGYVIDQSTQTQTVTVNPLDTQTLVFLNEPLCSLTLRKLDATNGKPVPGTEFVVKDGSGNILARCTTGKDGTVVVTGLVPGSTVVVVETRVPSGYVLNSTPQTIIVKNGSNTVASGSTGTVDGTATGNPSGATNVGGGTNGGNDLTFENDPKTTLTIQKFADGTTKPIQGATFLVTDSSGAVLGPNNGEYTTDKNGRIVIEELEPGVTITAREIKAAAGYKLDSTPQSIKIKVGQGQTMTFYNKAFSGVIIHKVNSVTGEGIYDVKFLVYDQNKNPIGEYSTDNEGYIYIDDLTVQGKGKLFIRELEAAPGYELDKEYKTVYVQPGKTVEIEWENTPITGQFQIYKYAAEYNEVTGTPAGAPLQGAVYEISEARSGKVVDYITTDARGVAASKPLPLGRYKIVEVTAPAYWQLSGKIFDETLEFSGQIIKVSDYDKPSNLGVTITKRGNNQVLAGSQMRYDFTVANTSNVPLSEFHWHDRIPTDAARATVFTTGTYSARLNYRILYKTNYSGVYQVLASNLLTSSSYSFSLNAIPTQAGEYVTDIYVDFGKVPVGFQSVVNPTLTVQVLGTVANGYQIINRADVGGKYQGAWQTGQASWVTIVRKLTSTVVPTLPKTGF